MYIRDLSLIGQLSEPRTPTQRLQNVADYLLTKGVSVSSRPFQHHTITTTLLPVK